MIDNLTLSTNAASIFTRIHTFLIEARFIQFTISTNHTLWTAANQRIAVVVCLTYTS